MINTWIVAILFFAIGLIAAAVILKAPLAFSNGKGGYTTKQVPKGTRLALALVVLAICFGIAGMSLFRLYGTESGRREIKDFTSNLSGIERVVKVYDMEGDLIASYQGRFDVDYDSSRIVFDDENGKRHIIYYSTGTVIIDEV